MICRQMFKPLSPRLALSLALARMRVRCERTAAARLRVTSQRAGFDKRSGSFVARDAESMHCRDLRMSGFRIQAYVSDEVSDTERQAYRGGESVTPRDRPTSQAS